MRPGLGYDVGMQDRVVARSVTPIIIAVQLCALVTALVWAFHGYVVGVPALVLSLFLSWRAVQAGFVLDNEGLHVRPFLPFAGARTIPWTRLQSVDVDQVVVGVEDRSRQPRLRIMIEGDTRPVTLINCRKPAIEAVLRAFQARGLPALDDRPT